MKKTVSKILSLLFLVLYISATMGFSIHKCNTEGTLQLMIMCGADVCDHEHKDVAGSGCCGEHHGEGCCSTVVFVLEEDQFVNSNEYQIHIPVIDIPLISANLLEEYNLAAANLQFLPSESVLRYIPETEQSIIISNRTLRV